MRGGPGGRAPGREGAPRAAFRRTTSDAALAREARRIGYVKPGERLFIVKGINAWQRSRRRDAVDLRVSRVDDRALVERQIGRRPRAFRRVVARCPYGTPAVTEQEPYDDDGRAVPDDLLPDLPAPRRRGLTPRGRRRGRALERGGRRGSALRPMSTRRGAQRGDPNRACCRAHGADHGGSLYCGYRRLTEPAELKCLHAHVAFALANPGTCSASACSTRFPSACRPGSVLLRAGAGRVIRPSRAHVGTGRTATAGSSGLAILRRPTAPRGLQGLGRAPAALGRLHARRARRRLRGLRRLDTAGDRGDGESPAGCAGRVVGDAAFHVYARGALTTPREPPDPRRRPPRRSPWPRVRRAVSWRSRFRLGIALDRL